MIRSAQEYHRRTSYDRARLSGHVLDWPNQPRVFKEYPGLVTVPLPETVEWPEDRLSDLFIQERGAVADSDTDLALVSRIVRLTHAVTAQARHGGALFHYRSVASAGALYPFELYVAAVDVSGLDSGLYHHALDLDGLTLLRSGSLVPDLAGAVAFDETAPPDLVFFVSSIFFRSSWKYRDRAYRYHLLDTGHMLENLALALAATRLSFKVHYDFDDRRIDSLLALDEQREACLAVVMVWGNTSPLGAQQSSLAPADPRLREASRVAVRESDYPMIGEIHLSSSRVEHPVDSPPSMTDSLGLTRGPGLQIQEAFPSAEVMSYPAAVFQRRSSRNFVREEVSTPALATMLRMLCSRTGADTQAERMPEWSVQVGLVVGRGQDVDPGFYLLDRDRQSIHPVLRESLTEQMAHVCLDQAWLGNCAVHFLFLSNLYVLEQTCGPRGYRYAMLTVGRYGQRLYLAATALRLGCCGIGAFYDREAAQLLGLNDDSELLYLVAAGPIKKWYGR